MGIVIEEGSLEDLKSCTSLIIEHWKEIANYQDAVPLEPDWQKYELIEQAGAFCFVMVKEDGETIGYSAFFLGNHPHYKSLIVAENDIIFLLKDKRKSGIGKTLIIECEKILKARGVNKIQWHVKFKHNFAPLLERLGYMKEDMILGRLL